MTIGVHYNVTQSVLGIILVKPNQFVRLIKLNTILFM